MTTITPTIAQQYQDIRNADTANDFDALFDYAFEQACIQNPGDADVPTLVLIASAALHLIISDMRVACHIERTDAQRLHYEIAEGARRMYRAAAASVGIHIIDLREVDDHVS